MKQSAPKLLLIGIWVALLAQAAIPGGPQRLAAAPLAVVTATEPPTRTPTPKPTSTPGPSPTNAPTATHKPDVGIADPVITKAVNVHEARIGDEVIFTITVSNRGTATAEDVVVTDPFPEYLDVIEATTTRGNITSNGRTVIINIGPVRRSDTITIRIRTRVNALAQPPEGRNIVTLTTSTSGDDPSNNSSEVTFQIVGEATPTAAPAPEATPAPTATPVVPANLPKTGSEEGGNPTALFAAFGLLLLGMLLLGRRDPRK
jgi:uncharacterized repeat protein (TIGR01451 family)/LPXTG-motif cell wall-anchored protein